MRLFAIDLTPVLNSRNENKFVCFFNSENDAPVSYSGIFLSFFHDDIICKSGVVRIWRYFFQNLKNFIQNRARAFDSDNDNLIPPKGILLVGIPGTGKSLTAKATASIMGWPLIRFDVSAVKNSLVGESERRMRQAVKTIQAFGNCICWIDEIDKSFTGTKSSGETDAGTTALLFGTFLTFMSENNSPVLVMATANNISALPPEFIRAGRFDATFFGEC
jgi:SpoVK/Ycf46/Vps4 family AAA+-type ATPase